MFFKNNPTSVTEKAPKEAKKPHEREDYDVGEAIGKSEARHDAPKPAEKPKHSMHESKK
jgi:hypothetical protein